MMICVPGITRPMGSGFHSAISSRVTGTLVTATVASVGPYVFHTSTPGKRSSICAPVSGAIVSPQKKKRFIAGNIAAEKPRSIMHICAKDGVDIHCVAPQFRSASKSWRKSAAVSFVSEKIVPPVLSAR